MDAELERKLRELVDRQEIWSVLVRYGRGIDRLDRELVRSCYWDDAIDDHHDFVGDPETFLTWALGITRDTNIVSHHGVGNHSCELAGDDAHAETYYTFIGANPDPPHMLSIGRYVDHFQRRGGEWRIANRVCVIEKIFDLAEPAHQHGGTGDLRHGPLLPARRDRLDLSYHRPVVPRRPKV